MFHTLRDVLELAFADRSFHTIIPFLLIKTLKVDIPCDIVYVALPKLLLILYDKQIDLTISKNQLFHSSNIIDHFCIHNNIYHRWLEANHKRSDHIFRCL